LLKSLLGISLALSPAILLLLFAAPLIGKRYGARLRPLIWLVLAVRLLIPFNTPIKVAIPVRQPEVWMTAPEFNAAAQNAGKPGGHMSGTGKSATSRVSPGLIIAGAWGAGAGLFLLYHTGVYIHAKRRLRRWSRDIQDEEILRRFGALKRELGIRRRVRLCVSAKAASPLLTGFFRPAIILPEKPPGEVALDFMLRHELTHLKRGDLWYKLLMLLVNAAHWFNPLVWLLASRAGFETELACDADMLAGTGRDERRSYGYTVLSFIEQGWRDRDPRCCTPLTSRLLGGRKQMKQRFLNITDTSAKKRGVPLLFAVILAAALAGSAAYAAEPPGKAQTPLESSVADAAKFEMAVKDFTQSNGTAEKDALPAAPQAEAANTAPEYMWDYIWPVEGEFLVATKFNDYQGHTGIDIVPKGAKPVNSQADIAAAPVKAARAGTVVKAADIGWGYGRHIIIDHGDGAQTLYAHNTELLAEVGEKVEQGRVIAKTGASGNALGEQLHFEIRQNGSCVDPGELLPKPTAEFIWPVKGGRVVAGLNAYPGHSGIDISGKDLLGAPVYAVKAGKVAFARGEDMPGYGRYVVIDHGGGFTTLYAHLQELLVEAGGEVAQGQSIGRVGSTGSTYGVGLHFETRQDGKITDPEQLLPR
jgi:murein DD-endopeptidase MepM/ murein hydrolase activator NlpD